MCAITITAVYKVGRNSICILTLYKKLFNIDELGCVGRYIGTSGRHLCSVHGARIPHKQLKRVGCRPM